MWWGIAYCDDAKTLDFTIRTLSKGERVYTVHLDANAKSPLTYAKHDSMFDKVYSLNEGDLQSTIRILQANGVVVPVKFLQMANY